MARLPSSDDSIAPVTILDANGHVVRVVPASAFRSSQTRIAASRRPSSGSVRAGGGYYTTPGQEQPSAKVDPKVSAIVYVAARAPDAGEDDAALAASTSIVFARIRFASNASANPSSFVVAGAGI
jgi:hypothetical protein